MRLIKRSTLEAFWRKHRRAETPLRQWMAVARTADWHNLRDVRIAFPHADPVVVSSGNTVTVFNIAGNDFRLIASIKYKWGIIYIRDFLTHAEYDKDSWKGRH
jgi:mRNA interferase HigB